MAGLIDRAGSDILQLAPGIKDLGSPPALDSAMEGSRFGTTLAECESFTVNTRRLSTVEPDTKGLSNHSQATRRFIARTRSVLRRTSESSLVLAEDRLFESSTDPISHPYSMRLLVQSGRMFLSQHRCTTRLGGPLDILLFGDCGCVDRPTYESCACRSNTSGDQCRIAFYFSCISYSPCLSL